MLWEGRGWRRPGGCSILIPGDSRPGTGAGQALARSMPMLHPVQSWQRSAEPGSLFCSRVTKTLRPSPTPPCGPGRRSGPGRESIRSPSRTGRGCHKCSLPGLRRLSCHGEVGTALKPMAQPKQELSGVSTLSHDLREAKGCVSASGCWDSRTRTLKQSFSNAPVRNYKFSPSRGEERKKEKLHERAKGQLHS